MSSSSETENRDEHLPNDPEPSRPPIAACERIETGLRTAATNAQQAIQEIAREFKRMVDMINADRAGRGVPPLDVEIKIPGAHDDGAFRAQ
jgi:hypothetical protein